MIRAILAVLSATFLLSASAWADRCVSISIYFEKHNPDTGETIRIPLRKYNPEKDGILPEVLVPDGNFEVTFKRGRQIPSRNTHVIEWEVENISVSITGENIGFKADSASLYRHPVTGEDLTATGKVEQKEKTCDAAFEVRTRRDQPHRLPNGAILTGLSESYYENSCEDAYEPVLTQCTPDTAGKTATDRTE